jgi:poly(hydroxyalkanoate) granule-associated protein
MSKARSAAQTPPSSPRHEDAPQGSAQQIWLAGLGALAQAQAQGTKAFEALVSDGLKLQQKTQAEAQQRLQEATDRLTHMAQDFGHQASGRVDRLEHMFEDRVARALQRLGIPSMADLQALQDRVQALEAAARRPAKTQVADAAATSGDAVHSRSTPRKTARKAGASSR